jgi:hypothetical protein
MMGPREAKGRLISHHAKDFRFLYEASASLLGYFVYTWYTHYLSVIAANLRRRSLRIHRQRYRRRHLYVAHGDIQP